MQVRQDGASGQVEPPLAAAPLVSRRPWEKHYFWAVSGADAVVLAAVLVAGNWAVDGWAGWHAIGARSAFLLAVLWFGLLALGDAYDVRRIGVGVEEYQFVLRAALRLFAALAIIVFVTRVRVTPGEVAVLVPTLGVLTVLARKLVRRVLHMNRDSGRAMSKVLAVGTMSSVRAMGIHLDRVPWAGYRVVAACVPDHTDVHLDMPTYVATSTEDVVAALARTGADVLAVVDVGTMPGWSLQSLAWQLESSGVRLIVAPAITDIAGPRIRIRPVAGLPLLHVEEPRLDGVSRWAKHAIDRVVAAVALVVLLPFVPFIYALIKLTSRGPVLFRQVRVGKGGREFTMFKLRTMVDGAEQALEQLRAHNEVLGPLFKMRRDPRVTTVGRMLRRLSIDELPQLINVVRGEMSIVGPRPPLPIEVAQFGERDRRRFLVRPGLTGLWQVSGRADLAWEETVRLDLYYVDNWSPALDMLIVAKTLHAIVRGGGAY